MASEIRVNTINNSSGLGTITISNTGAVFAGVTTITNLQVTGTTTGVVVSGVTTVSAGSTATPSISPSGDTNTGIFFPSADTIAFAEGGVEAARFDSSGRLLVGATSTFFSTEYKGYFAGDSNSNSGSVVIGRFQNTSGGVPMLNFVKSRGTSIGTNAIVSSGDEVGSIRFAAADGSNFVNAAEIRVDCDGTPGTNDMPGRLVFSTTADGASSVTERMRLDSSGRLGLGTNSPTKTLEVVKSSAGGTIIQFSDTVNATGRLGTPSSSVVAFGGNTDHNIVFGGWAADGNSFTTERVRIDSSGRLLVGTSSSRNVWGAAGVIQVEQVNNARSLTLTNNAANGNGATITLSKSRGTSIGSSTIVNNGDDIGVVAFAGADGSHLDSIAAYILCQVDGTPGSNDMPGRLVFSTTADGASSPTERMRITNAGHVWIGKTTQTTGNAHQIVETTLDTTLLVTKDNGNAAAVPISILHTATSGNNNFIQFFTETGTIRGSIDYNRSAGQVRYNVTSDRRLKSDIEDASCPCRPWTISSAPKGQWPFMHASGSKQTMVKAVSCTAG